LFLLSAAAAIFNLLPASQQASKSASKEIEAAQEEEERDNK